jgi:Streptomyces sporulation and cell division protein, SsgA
MRTGDGEEFDAFPLWIVDCQGQQTAAYGALAYRSSDPYAVSLTVKVPGKSDHLKLLFDRELLTQDLYCWVGDGPPSMSLESEGSPNVFSLRVPGCDVVFNMYAGDAFRFMIRTITLVPIGSESNFVDMDQILAKLLSRRVWRGVKLATRLRLRRFSRSR